MQVYRCDHRAAIDLEGEIDLDGAPRPVTAGHAPHPSPRPPAPPPERPAATGDQ